MVFRLTQKVLFRHCDPAGIVFYPRYFEMMNDCVEAFFDSLGHRFEDIHNRAATPTVHIETTFNRPSRHGDQLEFALTPLRIGGSSLDIQVLTRCEEEIRMSFNATLVYVDTQGRPTRWPDPLRTSLQHQITGET